MESGDSMRCDMSDEKKEPLEPFMKKRMPWVFVVLSALLAPPSFSANDTNVYSAKSIEGWVVEAGSKTPLEGVIVVVNWELTDANQLPAGQLMVMETVTDNNGHFIFPAWGPKPRPPKNTIVPKAPQLLLFKEGYGYRRFTNQAAVNDSSMALTSDWHGKTVEMRQLPNDAIVNMGPGRVVSRRSLSLNGLSLSLGWAYRGKNCEWKQAPRMLAAVHRSKMEFDHQGLRTDLRSIDDLPTSKKCGTPRDFFRSYLP